MTTWKLRPQNAKSAASVSYWTKDDETFTVTMSWRDALFICESDEQPNIDLVNADGIELYSSEYNWQVDIQDDCYSEQLDFPEDMDEEEQERLENLWSGYVDDEDEDAEEDPLTGDEALEEDGWECEKTEEWLYGALELLDEDDNVVAKG